MRTLNCDAGIITASFALGMCAMLAAAVYREHQKDQRIEALEMQIKLSAPRCPCFYEGFERGDKAGFQRGTKYPQQSKPARRSLGRQR
jgi:hypothetical protein